MPRVSEMMIKAVDPEGFDEVFYETVKDLGLPYADTFHVLNLFYKQTYGIKRYSSYDSYRRARRRRIQK